MVERASIWLRVCDPGQNTENQLPDLQAWASRRALDVVQVYEDARRGKFEVLPVWALDRLSREGPLASLGIIDRLGKAGVQVWSYQEN